MIGSRSSQPYRKGRARPKTKALYAMLRGRPRYGVSRADVRRGIARKR